MAKEDANFHPRGSPPSSEEIPTSASQERVPSVMESQGSLGQCLALWKKRQKATGIFMLVENDYVLREHDLSQVTMTLNSYISDD
jgi:hypothetical protein